MITVEIYHNQTNVQVKVKTKFYDDGGHRFGKMMALYFKYVKGRYYYVKTYGNLEYAEDRLDTDLKEIKKLFDGNVLTKRYKLIEEKKETA